MKELNRKKMNPIYVVPGDFICLNYEQFYYDKVSGEKLEILRSEKVLEQVIDKPYVFTGAVIFEVEKGEFGENVEAGLGGAFLQMKQEKKVRKSGKKEGK